MDVFPPTPAQLRELGFAESAPSPPHIPLPCSTPANPHIRHPNSRAVPGISPHPAVVSPAVFAPRVRPGSGSPFRSRAAPHLGSRGAALLTRSQRALDGILVEDEEVEEDVVEPLRSRSEPLALVRLDEDGKMVAKVKSSTRDFPGRGVGRRLANGWVLLSEEELEELIQSGRGSKRNSKDCAARCALVKAVVRKSRECAQECKNAMEKVTLIENQLRSEQSAHTAQQAQNLGKAQQLEVEMGELKRVVGVERAAQNRRNAFSQAQLQKAAEAVRRSEAEKQQQTAMVMNLQEKLHEQSAETEQLQTKVNEMAAEEERKKNRGLPAAKYLDFIGMDTYVRAVKTHGPVKAGDVIARSEVGRLIAGSVNEDGEWEEGNFQSQDNLRKRLSYLAGRWTSLTTGQDERKRDRIKKLLNSESYMIPLGWVTRFRKAHPGIFGEPEWTKNKLFRLQGEAISSGAYDRPGKKNQFIATWQRHMLENLIHRPQRSRFLGDDAWEVLLFWKYVRCLSKRTFNFLSNVFYGPADSTIREYKFTDEMQPCETPGLEHGVKVPRSYVKLVVEQLLATDYENSAAGLLLLGLFDEIDLIKCLSEAKVNGKYRIFGAHGISHPKQLLHLLPELDERMYGKAMAVMLRTPCGKHTWFAGWIATCQKVDTDETVAKFLREIEGDIRAELVEQLGSEDILQSKIRPFANLVADTDHADSDGDAVMREDLGLPAGWKVPEEQERWAREFDRPLIGIIVSDGDSAADKIQKYFARHYQLYVLNVLDFPHGAKIGRRVLFGNGHSVTTEEGESVMISLGELVRAVSACESIRISPKALHPTDKMNMRLVKELLDIPKLTEIKEKVSALPPERLDEPSKKRALETVKYLIHLANAFRCFHDPAVTLEEQLQIRRECTKYWSRVNIATVTQKCLRRWMLPLPHLVNVVQKLKVVTQDPVEQFFAIVRDNQKRLDLLGFTQKVSTALFIFILYASGGPGGTVPFPMWKETASDSYCLCTLGDGTYPLKTNMRRIGKRHRERGSDQETASDGDSSEELMELGDDSGSGTGAATDGDSSRELMRLGDDAEVGVVGEDEASEPSVEGPEEDSDGSEEEVTDPILELDDEVQAEQETVMNPLDGARALRICLKLETRRVHLGDLSEEVQILIDEVLWELHRRHGGFAIRESHVHQCLVVCPFCPSGRTYQRLCALAAHFLQLHSEYFAGRKRRIRATLTAHKVHSMTLERLKSGQMALHPKDLVQNGAPFSLNPNIEYEGSVDLQNLDYDDLLGILNTFPTTMVDESQPVDRISVGDGDLDGGLSSMMDEDEDEGEADRAMHNEEEASIASRLRKRKRNCRGRYDAVLAQEKALQASDLPEAISGADLNEHEAYAPPAMDEADIDVDWTEEDAEEVEREAKRRKVLEHKDAVLVLDTEFYQAAGPLQPPRHNWNTVNIGMVQSTGYGIPSLRVFTDVEDFSADVATRHAWETLPPNVRQMIRDRKVTTTQQEAWSQFFRVVNSLDADLVSIIVWGEVDATMVEGAKRRFGCAFRPDMTVIFIDARVFTRLFLREGSVEKCMAVLHITRKHLHEALADAKDELEILEKVLGGYGEIREACRIYYIVTKEEQEARDELFRTGEKGNKCIGWNKDIRAKVQNELSKLGTEFPFPFLKELPEEELPEEEEEDEEYVPETDAMDTTE